MKKIKTTITHRVPHSNLCNDDSLLSLNKQRLCKFCTKTNTGHVCLLYDTQLSSNDGFVSKAEACRMATAGVEIEEAAPQPAVNPMDLIKQTIDIYNNTVNDLLNQGYPRAMAETVAKKYLLDNK